MNKVVNRTIRNLVQVAFVALLAVPTLAADKQANGITEIRLWPAATVDNDEIKLSQIATITGNSSDAIAIKSLSVSIPIAGRTDFAIRAWQIAHRIADAGFDPANIRITGAARCKIHIVKDTQNISKPVIDDTTIDGQVNRAPRASLEAKIRKMICERLRKYVIAGKYKLKIEFNPVVRDLLALSSPAYQFDIRPQKRNQKWTGLVGLKVRVLKGGQIIQTVPLLVQVELSAKVMVAKHKINSKAIVTTNDVEWVWRDINQLRGRMPMTEDELSDHRSKHLISAGTILTEDLFEPIPLVKRGQLVTVIYRNSGLEIKTVGKAMKTGCKGEIIPVRNERSKNVFSTKIISSGKVLVNSASAGVNSSEYQLAVGSKQ